MQLWDGLFFFALFTTFLICALLLSKKNKKQSDIFLFIYVFSVSIALVAFYLYNEHSFKQVMPVLLYRNVFQVPWLVFYFYALIKAGQKFNKKLLYLFVPLCLSLIQIGWDLITVPVDTFFEIYRFGSETADLFHNLCFFLIMIIEPVVVFFLILELSRYKRKLKDVLSDIQGMEFRWLKVSLWSILIGSLCNLTYTHILSGYFAEYGVFVNNIGYGINFALVVYIGYFGLRHTFFFTPQVVVLQETAGDTEREGVEQREKYANSGLTDTEIKEIHMSLEKLIQNQKMYLNPKLGLAEVAEKAGYPSYFISEVLNKHMNTNFYEYINDMRVEEAKLKLADGSLERSTILGIALDSGFNSKSSFNRIFKHKTGVTPSHYAKLADKDKK